MKIKVEVTEQDLQRFEACADEIEDWLKQALRTSVDTWDGGLMFLDSFADMIEITEVST